MNLEQWCWVKGLGQRLGYRSLTGWDSETYPMLRLHGQQKKHRFVTVRGPGASVGTRILRPGWLRVTAGPQDRDFDMADPDSMDEAAEFVRSTYTKAQREWDRKRRGEVSK